MATTKIATKECVDCHRRYPANEMHSKIVDKRTGSSVGVYGFAKKGGKPKASVRAHYRKSQVWICDSCYNRFGRKMGRVFGFGFRPCVFIFHNWGGAHVS